MKSGSAANRRIAIGAAGVLGIAATALIWRSPSQVDNLVATVVRGSLAVTLTETGTLRPAEALTYRSRVAGRDIEIVWLAAEGTQIKAGDVLARLDTTDLEADLARATQELRQALLDKQVAEAERDAAEAALTSVSTGIAAVDADEARFNLRTAQQKAARLDQEYRVLEPLVEKGFVTREELDRAAQDAEQAQGSAELAKRRLAVLLEQSVPQQRQHAALDVAHRKAQIEAAQQRVAETSGRVAQLRRLVESCTVRAEHAGLVVYENNMASSPQRKIRVGDRVTPSQGLVTIPEVRRMLVDTSLREADLHRVAAGQPVSIALDAYPGLRLTGHVVSVGTVAATPPDRPNDGKRFDVVADVDSNSADLRSDMTATVQIKIAERADALLVPINAVFEQGDRRLVRVVSTRGVEIRPVMLGELNDLYVEVLSGLTEGERVRLSDVVPVGPEIEPAGGPPSQTVVAGVSLPARETGK